MTLCISTNWTIEIIDLTSLKVLYKSVDSLMAALDVIRNVILHKELFRLR